MHINIIILYFAMFLFVLSEAIAITCSLYFYNKCRGKKECKRVYICTFFFGIIAIIALALKKQKNSDNDDKISVRKMNGKYRIISIVLFLLYLILLVSGNVFLHNFKEKHIINESIVSENLEFYDKYGNKYASYNDVIFYTYDGCRFVIDDKSNCMLRISSDTDYDEEYSLIISYIDCNGNLTFTTEILKVDEQKSENCELMCLYDARNNYYAMASSVGWNSDGEMIHLYK